MHGTARADPELLNGIHTESSLSGARDALRDIIWNILQRDAVAGNSIAVHEWFVMLEPSIRKKPRAVLFNLNKSGARYSSYSKLKPGLDD
jgi:hypothetical protein